MDMLYWFTPWEESALVAVVAGTAAILFLRGCGRSHPRLQQKLYFWTGLILLYLVSHTQFDYYAEHQFFIHRLQHLVLHHLGPFLIILSSPWSTLLAGMPHPGRQLCAQIAEWKPLLYLDRVLCKPIIAVTLFSALIGFWLLPSVHFTAMIDWRLYRLMNWSMFINGLMFWGIVLHQRPILSVRLTPGSRIAMMLAVIPPQIVLGALIFFATREIYPIYTICGRAIGGVSAIADQQIGGIILWIHGAMMSAIGILIVARNELMPGKAREQEQPG
ncbi:cytochrome c oxidase assembly protein [Nitrosovibrio tenuis]|uniref:Putative membrane protein n=1 Tax=Nitrosovibrio tenuis TaxID=1233 RepID=A0A1H7MZX5_9PROT|nr:cytochrome c oxidase assembly protein [Nitrosovibrio tenuis]SEL16876.1 putative membrane protein [Nitrosovibrio tenuis]